MGCRTCVAFSFDVCDQRDIWYVSVYYRVDGSMLMLLAIIGMVAVGGLFVMGGGYFPHTFPQVLAALSVLLANVNIFGGFVITKRMLDMFKSEIWSSQT
jgi:NAD/NADP transhydrogenase alpha subunit